MQVLLIQGTRGALELPRCRASCLSPLLVANGNPSVPAVSVCGVPQTAGQSVPFRQLDSVFFSSHLFWTLSSLDVPAEVTQEEGHTGFLIHLPSAV